MTKTLPAVADLRTATPAQPGSSHELRSRADVTTDTPSRYAKQLVAHLGRKLTFTVAGHCSTAPVGSGTGQVVTGDNVLTLLAAGPDEESLALVEHVLGTHLERFGQRNELTVVWSRTTT